MIACRRGKCSVLDGDDGGLLNQGMMSAQVLHTAFADHQESTWLIFNNAGQVVTRFSSPTWHWDVPY